MHFATRVTTALVIAGAALSLAPAKPAVAALAFNQATITTNITVPNVCAFTTQSYVRNFTYDPINTNATTAPPPQAVALQYICTSGDATDKFTFDGGLNYASSSRRAKGASTNYVNYNLFTDATATTNPIASGGTVTGVTGTGYVPGTPLTTTIYVGIPVGQNTVTADSYTDTVTVTVTPT